MDKSQIAQVKGSFANFLTNNPGQVPQAPAPKAAWNLIHAPPCASYLVLGLPRNSVQACNC
jgi:hypothetical protein